MNQRIGQSKSISGSQLKNSNARIAMDRRLFCQRQRLAVHQRPKESWFQAGSRKSSAGCRFTRLGMIQQMSPFCTPRIDRPEMPPALHLPDRSDRPVLLHCVECDLFLCRFFTSGFILLGHLCHLTHRSLLPMILSMLQLLTYDQLLNDCGFSTPSPSPSPCHLSTEPDETMNLGLAAVHGWPLGARGVGEMATKI